MADRVLLIGWGSPVAGREERGLEVFDEGVGLLGRMQQDGRIEKIDVVLLDPDGGELEGFILVHGSAEQIDAVRQDEEFLRNTIDAGLIVQNLRHVEGYANDGVARVMGMYREAAARVPQGA
jgi:hypothetical protein